MVWSPFELWPQTHAFPRENVPSFACRVLASSIRASTLAHFNNPLSVLICPQEEGPGRLLYDAGNICNHYFSYDFLERVCNKYADTLTHHIAKKQIPCVDENGAHTKREGKRG